MSTVTIDLDTATDAQLNELFAVEVAGWSPTSDEWRNAGHTSSWKKWLDIPAIERGEAKTSGRGDHDAVFTTDANLVLPWLEKTFNYFTWYKRRDESWVFEASRGAGTGVMVETAPVKPNGAFPRAAVIALIRAKRASK